MEPTELHMLVKQTLRAGFSMKDIGDKLGVNKATVIHWSNDPRAKTRDGEASKISALQQMLGRNGSISAETTHH